MRVRLLSLIALLAFAAAAPAQRPGMSYGKAPQPGPPPLEQVDIGIDEKIGQSVPLDVTFRNELDNPVTLADCINGKPTILVLAYFRCPQLCTEVLNGLTECLMNISQYGIGTDFNVVTISFDPKDRPALAWEKKQSYVKEYGRSGAGRHEAAVKGWRFLTGDKASIDAITQAAGFRYVYDKQRKEYLHASGIMILKPTGELWRYFYGIKFSPLDVRLGLADMSGTGTFTATQGDKILLACGYQYDAKTGQYNFEVMFLLRVVFALTVIGLGIYLIRTWTRPRRLHAPAEVTPAVG